MAFQLIYTSSAHLLDSPLSGYGVVARSEQIPAALVRELVELSIYRPPADQGIEGAQFSYTVLECCSRTWHILTGTRPAGDDYTGRPCYLSHHIVLTDTEAQVYAAAGSGGPPSTPAGIILALELTGFWKRRWQSEPTIIDDNEFPLPIDCPSVEHQPTWHIFSGSPQNAALLASEHYTRSCLLLVPPGTRSRDVLRLLHEGNALTSTLGWGVSFCTQGTESDLLSGYITCSTSGSPLHQHALQTKAPVLDINPGMAPASADAPAPLAATDAAQEPMHPRRPARQGAAPAAAASRRRARGKQRTVIGLVTAALILLTALGLALCLKRPAAPPQPAAPAAKHAHSPAHH